MSVIPFPSRTIDPEPVMNCGVRLCRSCLCWTESAGLCDDCHRLTVKPPNPWNAIQPVLVITALMGFWAVILFLIFHHGGAR